MSLDHPLLLAVVPVVVAAFLKAAPPAATEWATGWFWRKWHNRPKAQRARIMVALHGLAEENKRVAARLTTHLDLEDEANVAMVAAATVDQRDREKRQDEIDAEFRAVDSRFERVEGRIDAMHAEVTGEIAGAREEVARLAGAVEVLIGQRPSSNAGWQGGQG